MKKRNLALLAFLPFLLALLGVSTAKILGSTIAKDITGISFAYRDNEGLKVGDTLTLEAKPIYDPKFVLGQGNDFVWKASIDDEAKSSHVSLTKQGGVYVLRALDEGKSIITCENEKGTVSKSFNLYTYQYGAILLNRKNRQSGARIDPKTYLGEYDLKNGKKTLAEVPFEIRVEPSSLEANLTVKEETSNISFDLNGKTLHVLSSGSSSFTLSLNNSSIPDITLSYTIIPNGINAYSYDDLLYATRENPSPLVLQTSFGRLSDCYSLDEKGKVLKDENGAPKKKDSTLALFGHYDFETEKFSFNEDVYSHETSYPHGFIEQWNEFVKKENTKRYRPIEANVLSALHLTKDLYGNGYSMDFHDLCYPKKTLRQNGREIPVLSSSDLFKGPLPFYCLGTPQNPLIEIYGQDNSGIYIDEDGVTIDDVKIRNADFGDSLADLEYVGNVLDIHADDVKIRNCVLENGKNVLRVYSSKNLLMENCLLSNARNFLLEIGNDEYVTPSWDEEKSFYTWKGEEGRSTLKNFFQEYSEGVAPELSADALLGEYLNTTSLSAEEREIALRGLRCLDNNLNGKSRVRDFYKTDMTIKDTLFYRSGISSIVFTSLFDGPFMERKSPAALRSLLSSLQGRSSENSFPLLAENIGGISYPAKLKLVGKSRFYDYKREEDFDLSGLIYQRLGDLLSSFSQEPVTIDRIFPIKQLLFPQIEEKGYQVKEKKETSEETDEFLNIPVSYYGGGVNLSSVDTSECEKSREFSSPFSCDLLDASLSQKTSSFSRFTSLSLKAINLVIGFSPFSFASYNSEKDGYLYGDYPKLDDLIQNAKGGNSL